MKNLKLSRRAGRVRLKLRAISDRPRLSVYRTNRHIWAQLIDNSGAVLASASTKSLDAKGTKVEQATQVGTKIAESVLAKKIKTITFDRGAYRYHGRVKALAEAARKAGLDF